MISQDQVTKENVALKVYQDPANFDVHRCPLVCHIILQDRATKGSCNFANGSPSWQITTIPSLADKAIAVVVMTPKDHMTEELCEFMSESPGLYIMSSPAPA